MNLYKSHFFPFLKQYQRENNPLLVAVSGGPDSMALLYLMLEYREKEGRAFSVAHVDHGWREESGEEAQAIKSLCQTLEIPFHHCQLDPNTFSGNQEGFCRQKRIDFFTHLCRDYQYSAVLLGHHQNDQAETVLKRVFEGARIEHCHGMFEETVIDGVSFWRPLLQVPKLKIIDWLKQKGIDFFDDATNRDPAYLRARMRENILPALSQKFGKNITSGLAFLGHESAMLDSFMSDHIKRWQSRGEFGPFGELWDLTEDGPLHLYEARFFISTVFPAASREIAYSAALHLIQGSANKRYIAGESILYLDRKRLLLTKEKLLEIPRKEVKLKRSGRIGQWIYELVEAGHRSNSTGWKQAVYGEIRASLNADVQGCMIGLPLAGSEAQKEEKRLRDKQQIPVFLRNTVPVVRKGGEIVCDGLSFDSAHDLHQKRFSIVFKKLFIENEGSI